MKKNNQGNLKDHIPEGMPKRAEFDQKTLVRLLSYMKDYKGTASNVNCSGNVVVKMIDS